MGQFAKAPARPELDRLIEAARSVVMTPAQLQQQKISFVFGQMPEESGVTKEQVAEAIYAREGNLSAMEAEISAARAERAPSPAPDRAGWEAGMREAYLDAADTCQSCADNYEASGMKQASVAMWMRAGAFRYLAETRVAPPAARPQGADTCAPGCDDATADKLLALLCRFLGVDIKDVEPGDGSEEWDGDVFATIVNVLKVARIYDDEDGQIARLPAQGADWQPPPFAGLRVRHVKRGSFYRVLGAGKVQTDAPLTDYAEVVVYQGEADGLIWVRPVSEFEDGRFSEEAAR